jgi:hypothetical protein
MSSAKKSDEMLMDPRSIPRPEVFSSVPRLFMKRLKKSGERLQPGILKVILWRKS